MPRIRQFQVNYDGYPPLTPRRVPCRRRPPSWGVQRIAPQSVAGIPVCDPYFFSAPLAGALGALSPEEAAESAFPKSSIRGTPGFTQAVLDGIAASAQAGQFTEFNPAGCRGVKPLKAVLVGTAGKFGLKFAPQAFAAGPIVGAIVLAGAGLATLFGHIFGHHAAAVARERSVICAAVPAANDTLYTIEQGVQSGTISPQQGQQALDNLLASFTQTVHSILKMDSSHCNAACVWIKTLQAIVAKKKSDYADLAAGPAGGITAAVSQAAASAGLPSWLLWAAGAYLAWKVL